MLLIGEEFRFTSGPTVGAANTVVFGPTQIEGTSPNKVFRLFLRNGGSNVGLNPVFGPAVPGTNVNLRAGTLTLQVQEAVLPGATWAAAIDPVTGVAATVTLVAGAEGYMGFIIRTNSAWFRLITVNTNQNWQCDVIGKFESIARAPINA